MMFSVNFVVQMFFYFSMKESYCESKEIYFPDYKYYHNLSRIYSRISEIVEKNPLYVQQDKSYKSRKGLPQIVLRVSNISESHKYSPFDDSFLKRSKLKLLFSYGEHAREFLPVESLLYLLDNITNGIIASDNSPSKQFSHLVLENIDLYVIVLLNPDGRDLIERTQDYCWRGTTSGVDLNRNFDWNFGGEGSSTLKGTEELRGPYAFSEPESTVLRTLTKKYSFDGFISFHSGTKEIYLPFADSKSKRLRRRPSNFEAMLELAEVMSTSCKPHFLFGQAYDILKYPADGTIFDFMAGIRQVPFTYAVELWGEGDTRDTHCFGVFNPSSKYLKDSVASIHSLYEIFFLYLIKWKQKQISLQLHNEIHKTPSQLHIVLLGIIVLLVLGVFNCQGLRRHVRIFYLQRRLRYYRSFNSSIYISGI